MGKKKKNNNKVIDLAKKRRVREHIKKIKEVYKDDPDGLDRLVDKLRRTPENGDDNGHENA